MDTLHRFFVVMTLMVALHFTQTGHAHEMRAAIIDMSIAANGHYQLTIQLNLEAIMAEIGPQHSNTSESTNANQYNQLRALSSDALNKVFTDYRQTFIDGIFLIADGNRLHPKVKHINIPDTGDTKLARVSTITLEGNITTNTQYLSWRWKDTFGALAMRLSTSHVTDGYTVFLLPGQSLKIPLNEVMVQSTWQIAGDYLIIGFEHIIPKGLDHILFVVGLFLLSLKLSTLLWQITSFTVAHSITLALGILGYVTVSPDIVEPLIALSIVYVCVENMLSDKLHQWRPVIIFSFGLLHGLGFASVLTEIGLSTKHFITSLIAFNVGLELGQLVVIAICFFSVAIWFSHNAWYRQRIAVPASAVIAIIGGYWFVERTIL